MTAAVKFECFPENLAEKVHNLGADQLIIFACAAANAPNAASNTILANLTQISYTNLSTTRNITTTSSSQTGGAYKLILTDHVLTASGGTVGPFRYIGIANDTATNDPLILYYDRGSDLTLQDGESITVDFHGTNGVITL